MTVQEAYKVMQDNCGIEVGDIVKVLRIAKDYEMGWSSVWNKGMDGYVGKTFTVSRIHSDHGIHIGLERRWWFPFFVLELVSKKPEVKEVTMAEVCSKFGCNVKIKKAE
jgi:hypothetical protein